MSKTKRKELSNDPVAALQRAAWTLTDNSHREPGRRGGRKSTLTPEKRKLVVAMVQVGGRLRDAALLVGVHPDALSRLRKTNKAFALLIAQAEATGKSHFLGRIWRGAGLDWRAAAWWLERRYRVEFGRQYADKDYGAKPVHVDLEFGDGKKVTAKLPSGVELVEREISPDSPDKVRTVSWPNKAKRFRKFEAKNTRAYERGERRKA